MSGILPKSKVARITAVVSTLASVTLVAAVAWNVWLNDDGRSQMAGSGPQADQAIGGPFELTNTQGNTVTAQDLEGGYTLVFFGYTHCPDVCPMTLQAMSQALDVVADNHPAKAERITPVFITIDPARDDVARMRDYVANFHPRLIGLTGDKQAIQQAAQAYHVSYKKVDPEEVAAAQQDTQNGDGQMSAADHAAMDHGAYLMQHQSYVFLMGPDGGHVDHVAASAGAPRIAEMIRQDVEG
ncbi:SCO family protein [Rhodovibrio salinarum]|uniref:SCO family protein n=1 Tax=Rhodovibrio salinarum TaxID=1087 RepID=A0A934QHM8_9PROT|nr:SCO family protein [Rhodovibrio salinarum]MBK1696969.1 SCO family protein [Rhodovibrio salinarum]